MSNAPLPAIERATLHLYQLFDLADSVDLDRARASIVQPTTPMRPVLTRGANIDIPDLPLELALGDGVVMTEWGQLRGHLQARIYDLGILSVRIEAALPDNLTWERAAELMGHVQTYPEALARVFADARDAVANMIMAAFDRPYTVIRTEEYAVLIVETLGPGMPASSLGREPQLVQVALGERRPLSKMAMKFATALSYYEDDLILLTWSAAIVIDPDPNARVDAAFLLEFANVQLLAFRTYDDQVERDLERLIPRIARRPPPRWFFSGAPARALHEIHSLIAQTTESSTRVENALKVSEDVYWNRVYMAALQVFRVEVWRAGISETLSVLRETAALLNDEEQVARQNLLEVLIIILIGIELIVALIGLHH